MRLAFFRGPGVFELSEGEVPSIAADELILKVKACGICGSDVHRYLGTFARREPPNTVLGHELAGEVVEDRGGAGRVGQRVGVQPFHGCGDCFYCARGLVNLCARMEHLGHDHCWGEREIIPGGMAELCPCWPDNAFELPPSISDEEAAILDGVAVGIHALHLGGLEPGMRVCVVGSGPIGLQTVQAARAMGAAEVYATDVRVEAVRLAEDLGADAVINAAERDPVAAVQELTRGVGVDLIVDTVGGESGTVLQDLEMVTKCGTVSMVAGCRQPIPLTRYSRGERRLVSSASYAHHGGVPEYRQAVDLVAAGKVRLKPLITHRFPLSEVERAFEVAAHHEVHGALKVVVFPEE